ncbi:MAG: 5'-nucleotidase C-terminal domain-containing protein [Chitinophagaceae bacterium]|nr:5'-nucleotidase C-terminal domain-containing protein [Chitinophagaceae bacterium]
MKRNDSVLVLLFIFLASCYSSYQPHSVQYKDYRITYPERIDSTFVDFLKPYRDSVNSTMNIVLAEAEATLQKKRPEGELGNFLADALLSVSQQQFNEPVDAAFVNYGGIRSASLAKGDITIGKVYELMPFDNVVTLQRLKGNVLQEFLDHVAALGGWPVSGLTMKIKGKQAVDVLIKGTPLDKNKVYNIVNSDYIANGGDNCVMLRNIPVVSTGYLMRDAFIEYIKQQHRNGKKINAVIENRVSYAE